MLCELCKKNDATVHLKQAQDGDVRELFVCPDCAKQSGMPASGPMSVADFLLGFGFAPPPGMAEDAGVACGRCGMTPAEFRKASRLGCPACYETFRDQLTLFMKTMHHAPTHKGKVPARHKALVEMASLERSMDEAVNAQNFEEAARLRDRLRVLAAEAAEGKGGAT